jgi:photosystem II stability/assembly factor-like uncharacterized protein
VLGNEVAPIYDVDIRGYGTGFDLSLAGARAHQRVHGGTIMVSRDGGKTWSALDDAEEEPDGRA